MVSLGAFCQNFKDECLSAGRTLPANRLEQALDAGGRREDCSEAWRCSSLTVTQDHTNRQQTFLDSDSLLFFLSISVSLYLFLSAAESGNET